MCVGWNDCEFGAPEIDPKRPYGNSDVEQDMIEVIGLTEAEGSQENEVFEFNLLGKKYLLTGDDKYNIDLENQNKLKDELYKLHKELETVLQICLVTQSFQVGLYECDEYSSKWRRIK